MREGATWSKSNVFTPTSLFTRDNRVTTNVFELPLLAPARRSRLIASIVGNGSEATRSSTVMLIALPCVVTMLVVVVDGDVGGGG